MTRLETVLDLQIAFSPDACEKEIEYLVGCHWEMQQAQKAFINQEIDFRTYLDYLEAFGMVMDSYMGVLEDNLDT